MKKPFHTGAGIILILFLLLAEAYSAPAADSSSGTLAESPLQVLSYESDGLLGAEVVGVIEYPFNRIRETLTEPAAWCEFLPIVFNIKSCIHGVRGDQTLLTLFIGRKFFDPPEEALQLKYVFRVLRQEEDCLKILLSAEEGPHGTRDYRIEVEARADANGRTCLRLDSSFRPSLRSKFATRVYLATTGRDKVGFSVLGTEGGEPEYVRGTKGIIERNAMRYYLALKAYLDTFELPSDNRFEARLNAWFDLTQRHPRQLYEMDRAEYLSIKRKERRYQLEMQGESNRFQVNQQQPREADRG